MRQNTGGAICLLPPSRDGGYIPYPPIVAPVPTPPGPGDTLCLGKGVLL